MRACLLLIVFCLVLLVLAEGRSSKDSKSKDAGSKSSGRDGKVTKVRAKPTRHHSSDSSESSEEHRHKHKKKHSEKFKSGERLGSRKVNTTLNHKIDLKHNSTRIFGGGFNNKTDKLFLLKKNDTSYEPFKIDNTHSTGLNGNKTLIGWKIFAKPNTTNPNSVNTTNNYVLTNFLHNEKGINGSHLHPLNNKSNNSVTPAPYGWMNINATTGAPLGWKNTKPTASAQGWKTNSDPVNEWNIEPSAPDYRKEFSFPDHRKDQRYYFDYPGLGGYLQRNPNSISDQNQNIAYPAGSDYSRKMISNIGHTFGWGVPQPLYINSDQYKTDGKVLINSYPVYKSHGSSEESSSKIAKRAKKLFKKLGKGTGKVLSSDAVKQAASSYFANPPPNGWIYNPPYDNARQTFYGRFSKAAGKEPLSADDWRSIVFGNVPTKVETRNLYSASFPETHQNLDLSVFSEKGRLPNFNQTHYKVNFPRPYYQTLFAGLHNEEITEHFRPKRELSEKGKAMVDAINKFFMHERDCNDTELNARKKRHLTIRPLGKIDGSGYDKEKRITNFPFSDVEAIVQSDNGISVYEIVPNEIQLANTTTEKSIVKEESTSSNAGGTGENNPSTPEPSVTTSQNRTKLFPVSESIEQFLNKKPTTRLRVIDESLENWKSNVRSSSNIPVPQHSEIINSNDQKANSTNWKRIGRSNEESNQRDSTPSYSWITGLRNTGSEVITPPVTQLYRETVEERDSTSDVLLNDTEIESSTPRMLHDSNDHYTATQNPRPILTAEENANHYEETSPITSVKSVEPSSKNGFYFFGVYINDYNGRTWENHVSNKAFDEPYDFASALEGIEKTTPVPNSFTEDSNLQTALMDSSFSMADLGYFNNDGSSTDNTQITSRPSFLEHTSSTKVSDNYASSKPLDSIVYVPFQIHSISSISYISDARKERSDSQQFENEEPITPRDDTSIIRAPLITNKCGRNQRMVKGRCRAVWARR